MKNYTKMGIQKSHFVFFTADLHFFHESIIEYCKRPFRDVVDMNEELIFRWNSVVPQKGRVFVLGDMFWKKGGFENCKKIMERLNGRKWLIAGNHDLFPRDDYLLMGFEDARDYLELQIDGHFVVCSHYPLLEWNKFYHGSWHLHGHVHGKNLPFSFRVMDVGVDVNNYMPVPWRDVVKRLDGGWALDEQGMREGGEMKLPCPYSF